MKKILIAIPTYNEFANINKLYRLIRKYNKHIKILFIDDNSNDGTIFQIRKIIQQDKKVTLIIRKKKMGIGSAHKYIFKRAFKDKIKYLITMDADLTHNPILINKMIYLVKYFHLVQTNRFLDKNSIKTWPIHRVILTKMRYFLLYFLLDIKHDSSGAYRCYNLERINQKTLLKSKNNSYSFFWESMHIFTKKKFKIKELSLIQNYRKEGNSKMTLSDWIFGLFYVFFIFFSSGKKKKF